MSHLPRRFRGLTTGAAAAAALLLTAGTAHAELGAGQLRSLSDRYLFQTPLEQFAHIREQHPHADQLDWSSDSCSYSPDAPFGFDFTDSCDRHDFGYRNYKKQDRFTEDGRHRIDDNLKSDMYSVCGKRLVCKGTANIYYFAVREFGSSSSSTAEAVHKADITRATDSSGQTVQFRAKARDGRTVEFGAGGQRQHG